MEKMKSLAWWSQKKSFTNLIDGAVEDVFSSGRRLMSYKSLKELLCTNGFIALHFPTDFTTFDPCQSHQLTLSHIFTLPK